MNNTEITTRPTLADVAQRAGVSKSAVSQVSNWVPGRRITIKDETRQKILKVVEEMGYRPSWRGQVLANRRSKAVAVVYSAPAGAVPRGVYLEMVDYLEGQLSRHDLCPAFVHVKDETARFDRLLDDARFDGCITLGVLSPKVLETLRKNQIPSVLINADADETWTRVNVSDDRGAELAMRHLLSLGHQNIAFHCGPTPPPHHSVGVRTAAYQRLMREADLTPMAPFAGPIDKFVEQLLEMKLRPTAVVGYDHWVAVTLLKELWRKGLRVPNDISVTSFNDAYPVAEVIPPLTVVSLPTRQMAEHAVRLLVERIDQPKLPPETVILQESLVIRESTAAPKT